LGSALSSRTGRGGARAILMGLCLPLLLFSTGCLHLGRPRTVSRRVPSPAPAAPTPVPEASPIVQGEEGFASWYGHPYHGRRAASGETYNMYDRTAAHRTLPFGTQVKVHDLNNHREVTVRINDRGPFVEGRIIDLSYAAARDIQMVGPGTTRVRLEILNLPPSGTPGAEPGIFGVQVGAFRERSNAQRLQESLSRQYSTVNIEDHDRGDGLLYRVRVGHESTEDAAVALAANLRRMNPGLEAFVVRLN
jgi:rare lipoprotein A